MRNHSKEYDGYMKSEEWAAKRDERLRLDDRHCVMCGRADGITRKGKPVLQVHHVSYKNLGHEPMEDLVSLCAGCHRKIHRYYKRFRTWEDKAAAGG